MASRLKEITIKILDNGMSADAWEEFRDATMDLASQVVFHLQKEELALVQRLGLLLEPGTDHWLAFKYTTDRSA